MTILLLIYAAYITFAYIHTINHDTNGISRTPPDDDCADD